MKGVARRLSKEVMSLISSLILTRTQDRWQPIYE